MTRRVHCSFHVHSDRPGNRPARSHRGHSVSDPAEAVVYAAVPDAGIKLRQLAGLIGLRYEIVRRSVELLTAAGKLVRRAGLIHRTT